MRLYGPTRLCGAVAASGSKNAALPIMAAALLADEPVSLENVPRLTDITTLARMLETLGMNVERRAGALRLQTIDPRPIKADWRLVSRMRASFCVLGPLLARRRRAIVPLPGGCRIGERPVDLHLRGLAALGAEIQIKGWHVVARARRLRGARIDLWGPHGPTVTGTANVLSAAVLARGMTVINGAACEPEIVDLGRFLQSLGARISGLGTRTIVVEGVAELDGGRYTIIPDRIETATLLLAAAMTRGSIAVTGAKPGHLAAVLGALRSAGAALETTSDTIRLTMCDRPAPIDIVARPYPGFPTDLQAQWTAWMCLADGRTTIRDTVFPRRFAHLAALRRFGASIVRHGSTVHVEGVGELHGAAVSACDLRASAALILAGLAAVGETRLTRTHHLRRGYEGLEAKLVALGAVISSAACEHSAQAFA
ncbi:MAG TPA: UDP-N-acetylglucosamine 1-carboxyvinyltransferase [Pirellulales bacterium]